MKLVLLIIFSFLIWSCQEDVTPIPCETTNENTSYTSQDLIGTWYFESYEDLNQNIEVDTIPVPSHARIEFDSTLSKFRCIYVNSGPGVFIKITNTMLELEILGMTKMYSIIHNVNEKRFVKSINESSCYLINNDKLQIFSKDVDTGGYYIMNFKR